MKKRHVAKGAVTSAAVDNRSLTAADFKLGAASRQYAAYLQPRAQDRRITVGWGDSSPPTPSELEYVAPGSYRIVFSRSDGLGCAVPTATPFSGNDGVHFRVISMDCNAQESFFQVATSNGQDSQFLLNVVFTD